MSVKPKLYNPRHPERTLLYQTVAEHYETWLELHLTPLELIDRIAVLADAHHCLHHAQRRYPADTRSHQGRF